MSCVQKIKNFILKKYYDFGRADVDLFNFHPQLFIILAVHGIFFVRRDSIRFTILFLSTGITVLGIVLNSLSIYNGVMVTVDYSLACESFCYLVCMSAMFAVLFGSFMNKNKIISLLEEMDADFLHVCSLGPRYREPFLKGQLLVWMLFVGWMGGTMVVGVSFILSPVVIQLHQNLLTTQDEYTKRPLALPLWLPIDDDPYRTPNYEIFFFLESLMFILFVLTYNGFVYLIIHFFLHNYTMLDMIILDFKVIFDGLDETVARLPKKDPRRVAVQLELNKRIKRIVTWHQSIYKAIKTVSSAFRMPMVFQMMLSSVVICLVSYQIAEKLENGVFNILFTMLGAATIFQQWIICYLGTILRNKGFAVGDACWSCGWHETPLGCMIRADIVIMIMRAQMPIYIKFTGQPVVELETFTAMFVVLAAQGIFIGRRDTYLRFGIPIFTTGIANIFILLQLLTFYNGVVTMDYSLACECSCYIMLMGFMFPVNIGFLMNKNKIQSQVEKMATNFQQVCSLEPRYRPPQRPSPPPQTPTYLPPSQPEHHEEYHEHHEHHHHHEPSMPFDFS